MTEQGASTHGVGAPSPFDSTQGQVSFGCPGVPVSPPVP